MFFASTVGGGAMCLVFTVPVRSEPVVETPELTGVVKEFTKKARPPVEALFKKAA